MFFQSTIYNMANILGGNKHWSGQKLCLIIETFVNYFDEIGSRRE